MIPLRALMPLVSAGLLLALLMVGDITPQRRQDDAAYFDRVGAAVDAIPYSIAGWIGVDVEASPSAVRLLRPNRIFQRRYMDPKTGAALQLLVVHCGDARDMLGHYPPVCYPAHGWTSGLVHPIELNGRSRGVSGRLYELSRPDGLETRSMRVVNFFVLPDPEQPTAAEMSAVESASGSATSVLLGAAQVQLVTEGALPAAELQAVATLFLDALEPVIRAVASEGRP